MKVIEDTTVFLVFPATLEGRRVQARKRATTEKTVMRYPDHLAHLLAGVAGRSPIMSMPMKGGTHDTIMLTKRDDERVRVSLLDASRTRTSSARTHKYILRPVFLEVMSPMTTNQRTERTCESRETTRSARKEMMEETGKQKRRTNRSRNGEQDNLEFVESERLDDDGSKGGDSSVRD